MTVWRRVGAGLYLGELAGHSVVLVRGVGKGNWLASSPGHGLFVAIGTLAEAKEQTATWFAKRIG